ncbi:hypothetical protein WQ54_22630 [Bacillus sp. SA1-12]|uniref:CBO0543 family protein n=1 Tax=Bacillus sp. SA1-12 TaxID=1455638 RepID=UPI00062721B4|nr:CBO0543 family protein [Bacillus sp. SA1-12]KKI89940.1 hypothetical protein WQ54_22630 [Bacillus sp. SA1-12]
MNTPSYDDVQKVREKLQESSFDHWVQDDVFALAWWILFFSTILPYVLWWKIVDKTNLFEIVAFGLLCAVLACFLDLIGVSLGLWGYPDKLISIIPPLIPADLIVIPVGSMIVYQYSSSWFSYILRYAIFAILLAYVIEPLFTLLDIYESYKWWNHTSSFVGLLLFGISIRAFIGFLKKQHQS